MLKNQTAMPPITSTNTHQKTAVKDKKSVNSNGMQRRYT